MPTSWHVEIEKLLEAMACLRSSDVIKVAVFKHSHTEGKPSVPKKISSSTLSQHLGMWKLKKFLKTI